MYMKLDEFLENNIPAYKLLDVLYNNDDIIVELYDQDVSNLPKNNSISNILLDKQSLIQCLDEKNMEISEFDKILQKYGWYISKVRSDSINILKLNNTDNGQYDDLDSVTHGLYLHVSDIKPSIILEQGLKISKGASLNIDKTVDTVYPDKRLYVWKLEDICKIKERDNDKIGKNLARGLVMLFKHIDAAYYGMYVYLVSLPENVKTHYDNEYGEFMPARYITQNVPPSYIRYMGTVDKLTTLIEYSEFRRLSELFGV